MIFLTALIVGLLLLTQRHSDSTAPLFTKTFECKLMEKENSRYFLFLDLIRYLAASIVALTHYEIYFLDQYRFEILTILAVEVFFVLSGFVLAKQIIYVVNGKKFYNFKIF